MQTTVIPPVKELSGKLYDKLKPSGWGDFLSGFLLSSEFDNILLELQRNAQKGLRFTPPLKKVFRAFEECPLSKLKVIVVGEKPYHEPEVSDGLFLSDPSGKMKATLAFVKQMDQHQKFMDNRYETDLTYLANQGVLLLHSALTTGLGTGTPHEDMWMPFTKYLFDAIDAKLNEGLVFIYIGQRAQQWSDLVNADKHFQFFLEDPKDATKEGWNSADVFRRINRLLLDQGEVVKW